MRVLLLFPQLPYPLDQGAKMRNFGLMRALATEHELHLLCFSHHPDPDAVQTLEKLFSGSVECVSFPHRSALERAGALFTSPLPDLALRAWSRPFLDRLRQVLASRDFQIVHASNLEMAPYLQYVHGMKCVFDDHNAEYALQERAWRSSDSLGLGGVYSRLQAERLREFEASVCRAADLVLAVSPEDADLLHELSPEIRPVVIPNGLDLEHYGAFPRPVEVRPFLLFSGKLDYRPNLDAVSWFLEAVLPRIWETHPSTRFLVVGQAPPQWLVRRGQHDSRIVVTGQVPDDRPYLERSSAYVLPMRWGGGVRFKALVALAAGRPLLATTLGVDGLGCVPGEHALVAEDAETFAANARRVLDDPEIWQRLASAGRSFVAQRFSWRRIAPVLLGAYRTLETTRARAT